MNPAENLKRVEPVDEQAVPSPLETVVAEVAEDARREPLAYANDTRVPEGGE